MTEKYIEMLRQQIDKLNNPDFNLKSWKTSTKVILSSIFGENNSKLKMIDQLQNTLTSWSLRDTTGVSGVKECKRTGKEILEACIMELEAKRGKESSTTEEISIPAELIINALDNELKGSQYKALKQLINSAKGREAKKKEIIEFFKKCDSETPGLILSEILCNDQLKNTL